LRALVSYADQEQNHLGVIYQATNWIYFGETGKRNSVEYLINGEWVHKRTADGKYSGDFLKKCLIKHRLPKHKYVYPLKKELRGIYKSKALPYPKICGGSDTRDTRLNHGLKGGATPTPPLEEVF